MFLQLSLSQAKLLAGECQFKVMHVGFERGPACTEEHWHGWRRC